MRNQNTSQAQASNPAHGASTRNFAQLSRYLGRISKDADIHSVHRFRTNSRRVEVLIEELAPDGNRKQKLLKQLSKLRKKAGKVRDLDVQIGFLKELKMPDRQNHRAELMERMREEQERRTRKLLKNVSPDRVKKIRKRLRRLKWEMKFDGIDPLQIALRRVPRLPESALTEQALHACRIAAKQARYMAELAGDSVEAKTFIDQLKRAQDEIGQWHDVVKLKERAEKLFGGVHDSPLVSALQNISRARFRRANSVLMTALAAVDELRRNGSAPKAIEPSRERVQATAAA